MKSTGGRCILRGWVGVGGLGGSKVVRFVGFRVLEVVTTATVGGGGEGEGGE